MGCLYKIQMIRGTKTMKFVVVLWLFSLCTMNIQATTHWMVTESGLIQPRVRYQFPFEQCCYLRNRTIAWPRYYFMKSSIIVVWDVKKHLKGFTGIHVPCFPIKHYLLAEDKF